MIAALWFVGAGLAGFLLLDIACYFWLRHNDATREAQTRFGGLGSNYRAGKEVRHSR